MWLGKIIVFNTGKIKDPSALLRYWSISISVCRKFLSQICLLTNWLTREIQQKKPWIIFDLCGTHDPNILGQNEGSSGSGVYLLVKLWIRTAFYILWVSARLVCLYLKEERLRNNLILNEDCARYLVVREKKFFCSCSSYFAIWYLIWPENRGGKNKTWSLCPHLRRISFHNVENGLTFLGNGERAL